MSMVSELFFFVFNVQHGHATYIKFPNGNHWMIDVGKGKLGETNLDFSPLSHLRYRYGVSRLDRLIITHPHHDHIEDIGNLHLTPPLVVTAPRHLTAAEVRADNPKNQLSEVEEYLRLLNSASEPLQPAQDPELAQNAGNVWVRTFYPSEKAATNLNNHSIVTVLKYAKTKVLIPGDNEPPSWRELLEIPAFVSAIKDTDILLAPHHGRESGFCEDIFEHFTPRLTIISDARGVETSATDKYRNKGDGVGMVVSHRSGEEDETRHTVSTKNDGGIAVWLGYDESGNALYNISVN